MIYENQDVAPQLMSVKEDRRRAHCLILLNSQGYIGEL